MSKRRIVGMLAVLAGGLAIVGCSPGTPSYSGVRPGGSGGSGTVTDAEGTGGTRADAAEAADAGDAASDVAATGGAGGADRDGGGAGDGRVDGSGGTGGTAIPVDALPDEITRVAPSAGCGTAPGQELGMPLKGTILTMGTKPSDAADTRKGAWSYQREYFVTLPRGYDGHQAYPLVFEAPGCGGTGLTVYPLNNAVNGTVIRVGLTPPPNDIGHPLIPTLGCFDDLEGDDSVDWVFYENLYDKLAGQLCFDRDRVFAVGNNSGGIFANELGCKYAGDATRPIRGVVTDAGSLPPGTGTPYVVTCASKPLAGLWVFGVGFDDLGVRQNGDPGPISRAMQVNGCTLGTSYAGAVFDSFPIGGDVTVCKKVRGCPERYPLVACPVPGNTQSSNDAVVNPAAALFISLFSQPPLLTPTP